MSSFASMGRYINVDEDGEITHSDEPEFEIVSVGENGQNHTLREFCRARLKEIFENQDDIIKLEKALFNAVIDIAEKSNIDLNWKSFQFRNAYKQKTTSLLFNLTDKNNTTLLDRVANGTIPLENLPRLTSHDLNPQLWAPIFEKVGQVHDMGDESTKVDGMFRCGKCKSYKTYQYQLQTRSADESMTTYVTCVECKHVMKF